MFAPLSNVPWKRRKPGLGLAQLNLDDSLIQGLIGCWLFNEGLGTTGHDLTTQEMGGGNNFTFTLNSGSTTNWIPGKFSGPALTFDGTAGVGSAPYSGFNTSSPPVPTSYCSWFLPTSGAVGICVEGRGLTTTQGLLTYTDNSDSHAKMFGQYSNTSLSVASTTNVYDGRWHHIVGTCDGNSTSLFSLYVDGILENTGSANLGHFSSTLPVVIRLGQSADPAFHAGSNDLTMVYNRSLSAGEVNRLYVQTFDFLAPRRRTVGFLTGPAIPKPIPTALVARVDPKFFIATEAY